MGSKQVQKEKMAPEDSAPGRRPPPHSRNMQSDRNAAICQELDLLSARHEIFQLHEPTFPPLTHGSEATFLTPITQKGKLRPREATEPGSSPDTKPWALCVAAPMRLSPGCTPSCKYIESQLGSEGPGARLPDSSHQHWNPWFPEIHQGCDGGIVRI